MMEMITAGLATVGWGTGLLVLVVMAALPLLLHVGNRAHTGNRLHVGDRR